MLPPLAKQTAPTAWALLSAASRRLRLHKDDHLVIKKHLQKMPMLFYLCAHF